MGVEELENVVVRKVDTADDAAEFMRWIGERRPILSCDTETTGLKWWTPNFVRLLQFGDANTGWCWDHQEWKGLSRLACQAVHDSGMPVVFHNASFDLHALEVSGLALPQMNRIHDTKILHHLVDNLANHSLKPISDAYWPGASGGQAMLKAYFAKTGTFWDTVPTDEPIYWAYGALDPVLTARVAEKLWPLVEPFQAAYDVEMAAQLILWKAETRGMRVDPSYTADLLRRYGEEAQDLEVKLKALGIDKPGSNKVVTAILEEAGWEPKAWTETGLVKLDKAVLHELIAGLGVTGEVATMVMRYRRLTKWASAYLTTFLEDRDGTDHLHASINSMAARTGRMSISNPGLQTLPRGTEIKQCIIPEDGHHLLEVDWQSEEARLFAIYSGDANLLAAFDRGDDIHRYVASKAYGMDIEDVPAELRQIAKTVIFALLYGAGPAKIAASAGVPQSEIEHFLNGMYSQFPGIKSFMSAVDEQSRARIVAEGRPYVKTHGGRRLYSELDKTYSLVNYLIQGSGADVIKQTAVDLDAAGLADYIVVPVHDSFLFSIPDHLFTEAREEIIEIMTRTEFETPLTVDASGPLASWGDK